MAERNEIRVSDQDPEMLAIKALSSVLAPLDPVARKRVLEWASDRFVEGPVRLWKSEEYERLSAQLEFLRTRAKELGVSDRELIHAFSALREGKVAPIEVRTEIREAEEKLRAGS
jgi:aryl-alcohol dehydrogenase-like predicted oxidoreductase